MCGIAGQFNFERREPVERETIVRMARSIAHRGPDDEGFFIAGPVGLGFRRLSIIDLAGGHQPMSDAEETVWVIFNGEIYNYKELRAELEGLGHRPGLLRAAVRRDVAARRQRKCLGALWQIDKRQITRCRPQGSLYIEK